MFEDYIAWALTNFWLIMFLLAAVFALIYKFTYFSSVPTSESIYKWFAFFPLGITLIYGFVMQAFYPNFTAALMGWEASPFQYLVAIANLSFGLMALLSFNASYGFRAATVIGTSCWLWGIVAGYVYPLIMNQSFSLSSVSVWFWMDITMPIILILTLLDLRERST